MSKAIDEFEKWVNDGKPLVNHVNSFLAGWNAALAESTRVATRRAAAGEVVLPGDFLGLQERSDSEASTAEVR